MKTKLYILSILITAVCFQSCEKDNLDAPGARFYGEIRDSKTDELIPQEIINGSKIYYVEQGWNTPEVQDMVVKKDGTFRNDMMFAAHYKVILTRGNYVELDTMDIQIKNGNNEHIFRVTPYLRILDPEIKLEGRKITARFRVEQVTNNTVQRISLFAHAHEDVANSMNIINITQDINRIVSENERFELSINLDDYTNTLLKGKSYYFRIGAQSNGNETKYNYAKSLQLKIDE